MNARSWPCLASNENLLGASVCESIKRTNVHLHIRCDRGYRPALCHISTLDCVVVPSRNKPCLCALKNGHSTRGWWGYAHAFKRLRFWLRSNVEKSRSTNATSHRRAASCTWDSDCHSAMLTWEILLHAMETPAKTIVTANRESMNCHENLCTSALDDVTPQ